MGRGKKIYKIVIQWNRNTNAKAKATSIATLQVTERKGISICTSIKKTLSATLS